MLYRILSAFSVSRRLSITARRVFDALFYKKYALINKVKSSFSAKLVQTQRAKLIMLLVWTKKKPPNMTRSSIQYVPKYYFESTKTGNHGNVRTRAGSYEIIRNRQKSNGTFFKDLIQLGDVFCLSGSDDLKLALYNGQLSSDIIQ